MTECNTRDRARDIELLADTVTLAIKAALPLIVRREVELQLGARSNGRDASQQTSPNNTHRGK